MNLDYRKGQRDVWDFLKIVADKFFDGKISPPDFVKLFRKSTIDEVIKEVKTNELDFHVGDEIEIATHYVDKKSIKVVITKFYWDNEWQAMRVSGITCNGLTYRSLLEEKDFVGKTGRHFPQVEEIIKVMNESALTHKKRVLK